MKRIPLAASAVVLAPGLTACGGAGGGAPTDASADKFCDAQLSVLDIEADPEDDKKVAEALNTWADELAEVGTPKDISEDARKGFELQVDQLSDVSADDIAEAKKAMEKSAQEDEPSGLDQALGEFTKDEQKQIEAFSEYSAKTCAKQQEQKLQEKMGDVTKELEENEGVEGLSDEDMKELEQQLEGLSEDQPTQ